MNAFSFSLLDVRWALQFVCWIGVFRFDECFFCFLMVDRRSTNDDAAMSVTEEDDQR
jgi:hypothetical protein